MGSDTRQYTNMFFIKLATEHRLFYKEQKGILSRVAARVNKPLVLKSSEGNTLIAYPRLGVGWISGFAFG